MASRVIFRGIITATCSKHVRIKYWPVLVNDGVTAPNTIQLRPEVKRKRIFLLHHLYFDKIHLTSGYWGINAMRCTGMLSSGKF